MMMSPRYMGSNHWQDRNCKAVALVSLELSSNHRAMTSGAVSLIPGASQAGGSVLFVERAQEVRRAKNGRWYTEAEFKQYYWD